MNKVKFLVAVLSFMLFGRITFGQIRLEKAIAGYDYKEAIAVIDSLLKDCDSSRMRGLLLEKAGCLEKIYRFDDAIEILSGIMIPGRIDNEVLARLADCYSKNGDMDDAMSCYSILCMKNPDNIYFRIRKMLLYYKGKKYDNSISVGKEILSGDSIPSVMKLVGDSYKQMGAKDSALFYYDKVLRLNPSDRAVIDKMSGIMLDQKRYDDVIDITGNYLDSIAPDDPVINPINGLAFYLKGDYARSLQVFRHQEELGDCSYSTYYYIGVNYYMLNKMSYAVDELKKAYQIDSSDVGLLVYLGSAESQALEPFDSVVKPLFEKAIVKMLPDSSVMYNIYQSYAAAVYRNQDWKKAVELYKKAYGYNSSATSCLSTIGYCYEQLKDYKSALEWYEKYKAVCNPGTKGFDFAVQSIKYMKARLFMDMR